MLSEMRQFRAITSRALDKLDSGWRRLSGVPSRLFYSFYTDQSPEYKACLLVAGSGRGGTTWLAEAINYDNSYRFMFEPFYHARVPISKVFGDCQYLRPENDDPRFLRAAERIFSGRVRNGWVDAYNRKLRATRRLVKDIRVNLLLGWIRAHFPEMPIVLLLRHPCAVAYSRCRSQWTTDLEATFFNQPALVQDYLNPFLEGLKELRTAFERHIFSWCIETYVPLMQLTSGDALITTYEDCVVSPEREFQRIFTYLNRPFHDDVLSSLGKPSSQTRRNRRSGDASPVVTGEPIIDSWQQAVDSDAVRRALEIQALFGLDQIYGSDPIPNTSAFTRFVRSSKIMGMI